MNIAITGEGIISAIGTNKEEVLQSLLAHKSGIKEMQFLQSVHHELPVGEVTLSNEQMKKRLGIPEKQLMSRTELMGILAIRQALVMLESTFLQSLLPTRRSSSFRERRLAEWTLPNRVSTHSTSNFSHSRK